MRLRIEQVATLLGPTLQQFWPVPKAAARQVFRVTVLSHPRQLCEATAGELAIFSLTRDTGQGLCEALQTMAAPHLAMLLIPGTLAPPESRRQLRAVMADEGVALGLLSPEAEPQVIANRLNRILTPSHTEATHWALQTADTLQEIAETLGHLVQNSVTIETPQHELLAFSPAGRDVDRVREETILQRHGSRPVNTWAEREGYFTAMRKSDWPVKIPPNPELNFSGRVIMRVASEEELVAIIWVTDTARPLGERDYSAIREAAAAAAVTLLEQRSVMQREAEARADFIEDIVQGRISSPESIRSVAHSLGWNIDRLQHALVISIDNFESFRVDHARRSSGRLRRARERLVEIIRLEVLAVDPNAVVGLRSASVVVLFGTGETDATARKESALRLGDRIVKRVAAADLGMTVTVGLGEEFLSLEHLAESWRQAALAAELGNSLLGGNRTIHYDDLGVHRVLFALHDREGMIPSALERIVAYDTQHETDYVATLASYFACMGRLSAMAEQLGVHRNTIEYRMARIEGLAGIDLSDANIRLALELGIRLLSLRQQLNHRRDLG